VKTADPLDLRTRMCKNGNMRIHVKIALFLLAFLLGCGPSDKPQGNVNSAGPAFAPTAFDPSHVPEDLRDLVPLARKWGIGDDVERAKLIESASAEELQALQEAVSPKSARIAEWLDSFPQNALSNEAAAFMYLLEVVDELSNE
jgi:hypothetical protein